MAATKEKRALFGGTLRCAGLAAAAMTANAAGGFIPAFGLQYTHIIAYDPNIAFLFNYSDSQLDAVFAEDQNYSGLGGSMSAYSGSTLMGLRVSGFNENYWGVVIAEGYQYFTVDSTKEVFLEWDFGAADAYARVYEFGVGDLAFIDEDSEPGSLALTLSPGSTYRFAGQILADAPGDVFVRLSNIPAPGVLPLLGIGLVTGRRRRRE